MAEGKKGFVAEFKEFISQGNVVDLAVAVVIGAAFGAIVTSFVNDVLMQLIGAIFGKPSFNGLVFVINGSEIRYGNFLNFVVNFLIIAFALFLVVKGVNALRNMRKTEEEATERECPECLSEIPVAAKRCKFCSAESQPAA